MSLNSPMVTSALWISAFFLARLSGYLLGTRGWKLQVISTVLFSILIAVLANVALYSANQDFYPLTTLACGNAILMMLAVLSAKDPGSA